MSKLAGVSSPRTVSALVGSVKVNRMLGLEVYLAQDELADLLERCGVRALGTGARGCLVWSESEIAGQLEAIQLAHRATAAGLNPDFAEIVERVLAAKVGEAVRQAMERMVAPALDETDARLDKLQEAQQGLFRQQGENGQRTRDVLLAVSPLVAEMRASSAALKKDVIAVLGDLAARSEISDGRVREELEALRMSVNELCKVLK